MPQDDLDQFLYGAGMYQPPPQEAPQEEPKDDLDSFLSSSGVYESPRKDLSRWEQARQMPDPVGIQNLQDRVRGIAHVDIGKTGANLVQQAKGFVPGMAKLAADLFGPRPQEPQITGQPEPERIPLYRGSGVAMGSMSQAGAQDAGRRIQATGELLAYVPKFLVEFAKNPKETIENRPLDVLMLLAGKGVHSAKKALTVDVLTKKHLQAAFSETLAKPEKFKLAPDEVAAVDYLNKTLEGPEMAAQVPQKAPVSEPTLSPGALQKETAVPPSAPTGADAKVKNYLKNAIEKSMQNEEAAYILEEMEVSGISPEAVSKKFWNETYDQLPEVGKRSIEKYVKSLWGIKPGEVYATQGGKSLIAESWKQLGLEMGLGDTIEGLEGIERGYTLMMQWANDTVAKATAQSGAKALGEGGRIIDTTLAKPAQQPKSTPTGEVRPFDPRYKEAIDQIDATWTTDALIKERQLKRTLTGEERSALRNAELKRNGIDPSLPMEQWESAWMKSRGIDTTVAKPAQIVEPSGIPGEFAPPKGAVPTDIPPVFMKMPMDTLTKMADQGVVGAKKALAARKPGPGEVKGLGIEFVDNEGRPISRADAFRARKNPEVVPAQEGARKMPVVAPPPEAADQPPMVREFFDAIKSANRLTPKQKNLYSIERKRRLGQAMQEGQKIGGKAGYEAQMKALGGSLERVDFEPLKLTQEHIDSLFQYVEDSPKVLGFDKISAKNGLAKMLGEKGAGIPQPKELSLLKDVFGPEIVSDVIGKQPWWTRAKDIGVDLLNVPRAFATSADLSFGLRQGIYYMSRHPVKFWKDFPKQFQWFASDKASKAVFDEVRNRETYPLMREAGLDVIGKEEPFQSGIAEKVPLAGAVVKASSRAYTTFATKLRADAFDALVKTAQRTGRNPWEEPLLAKRMAELVNMQTGRGDLGRLERISKELNAAFFSPKLMASRLNVIHPKFYIKADPIIRREALTNLAAFAGYAGTVVGLSKLAGLEVGVNPTSADFGKIKVGNTRIDLFGGFSQYVRLASQLITQKVTSTTTGKVIKLGEGYKPTTSMDILLRFAEAKEAPVFSFATGLFKGQNWIGDKFAIGPEIAQRFIPMVIQDFMDIYKDDQSLLPLGFLGAFGAGLQTYQPRPPAPPAKPKTRVY